MEACLVFSLVSGGQELTSSCPNQPCLSLVNHRTFAWRRWQLRVTGVSVACGYAGPLEVGSHTAAARPVGRGVWLREFLLGPGGPPTSPQCLANVLDFSEKNVMALNLVLAGTLRLTPGLSSSLDPSMACPQESPGADRYKVGGPLLLTEL